MDRIKEKSRKNSFYRGAKMAAVAVFALVVTGFAGLLATDIEVEGARGYFSDITLYSTSGKTVNAGPVVGIADVSGNDVTVKITGIPAGTYNRVNVTMAGFPGGNDAMLDKNNSFVVTGNVNGKDIDYRSNKKINKEFRFNSPVTVGSDGVMTISANVDFEEAFMSNGSVLDPENSANIRQIGKNMGRIFKTAFQIQ